MTGGFSGGEELRWDSLQLYTREEAPAILQFNPHVKSGYRAGLTPAQCLCSIFKCHNETGPPSKLLVCCLPTASLGPTIWTPSKNLPCAALLTYALLVRGSSELSRNSLNPPSHNGGLFSLARPVMTTLRHQNTASPAMPLSDPHHVSRIPLSSSRY